MFWEEHNDQSPRANILELYLTLQLTQYTDHQVTNLWSGQSSTQSGIILCVCNFSNNKYSAYC